MEDKLLGTLIGCIVGDALGAPFEFYFHRNNIYTGLIYIDTEYHFRFCNWSQVAGQYTDDTEMTLCNVRTIIESKGIYNRDLTIKKYMEWASETKSMGRNTRALFKGVKTIKGYEKRFEKIFGDTGQEDWTQSNGSLMRCSILSFFGDEAVIADCKLTNPHPINIDSSRLYAYLIRASANDESKKKILKHVRKMDLEPDVMATFEEAIKSKVPKRDVTGKNKGWVLHGLYSACWAWYWADTYQDGIDTIIRLGGDSDTNAAIAGGIIGAKLGMEAMCNEERTNLNMFIVLVADSSEGDNPLRDWLRLDDFFDVVKKLNKLIDKL